MEGITEYRMAYTKAEKEKLIRHLKLQGEKRIQALHAESERIAETCENKVLRRINAASVTLWNIRLKDVLEVERHHKPTIKGLLKDIQSLQANSSNYSNNGSNRSSSIRSSRGTSKSKVTKP